MQVIGVHLVARAECKKSDTNRKNSLVVNIWMIVQLCISNTVLFRTLTVPFCICSFLLLVWYWTDTAAAAAAALPRARQIFTWNCILISRKNFPTVLLLLVQSALYVRQLPFTLLCNNVVAPIVVHYISEGLLFFQFFSSITLVIILFWVRVARFVFLFLYCFWYFAHYYAAEYLE